MLGESKDGVNSNPGSSSDRSVQLPSTTHALIEGHQPPTACGRRGDWGPGERALVAGAGLVSAGGHLLANDEAVAAGLQRDVGRRVLDDTEVNVEGESGRERRQVAPQVGASGAGAVGFD